MGRKKISETETPQKRWDKKNTAVISIRMMNESDADVLEWWNKQPKKAEAFRRMVRQQIETETAAKLSQEN